MSKHVDSERYKEFVNAVTSQESKDHLSFLERVAVLQKDGFPVERLLTASVGLCAEAGEFTEVVKKIVFQGKPVNEENLFHLKRELGDVCFYLMEACLGLDVSLDEVIQMNVEKLEKRYPGGKFSVERSENRNEGDV